MKRTTARLAVAALTFGLTAACFSPLLAETDDDDDQTMAGCAYLSFSAEGATDGCLDELEEMGWEGEGSLHCILTIFSHNPGPPLYGMECTAVWEDD